VAAEVIDFVEDVFEFVIELMLFVFVTFGTPTFELAVVAGAADINCAPQTPLFC